MPRKIRPKNVVLLFTLIALYHCEAIAGSKPEKAVSANPREIEVAFAENSWRWNNEKGGVYHAKNGKLIAILNYDDVLGIGRWSVNAKGTLCHNAIWYWKREKLKQRKVKDCWKHVVDQDGKLWQHDRKYGWYRFPINQISPGNKYSRRVNRLKKNFGL